MFVSPASRQQRRRQMVALVTAPLSQFALTTSLQLRGVLSDETGSGSAVFSVAPTISGPVLTGTVDLSSASSGQVKFPAAQNASADVNTLDDYEEGNWTPGIAFGGASVGITYSGQAGKYIKIGKFVWLRGNVNLSNKGSSTGPATITGLPFTGAEYTYVGMNSYGGMSASTAINGEVNASTTVVSLVIPGAAATANANDTNFTNSSYLYFTAVLSN